MNPINSGEEYEFTTLGKNHFNLKLIDRAQSTVTMYSATRVIVPPPLTFMQKYGMSLLMAGFIIIQVNNRRFTLTCRWL